MVEKVFRIWKLRVKKLKEKPYLLDFGRGLEGRFWKGLANVCKRNNKTWSRIL